MPSRLLVALAVASHLACGTPPGTPPDATNEADPADATTSTTDAAAFAEDDAGDGLPDASDDAIDAGPEPFDAGEEPDASEEIVDAGDEGIDAGEALVDAGSETFDAGPDGVDAGETNVDGGPSCAMTVQHVTPLASPHVALCSPLTYASEPPSSGPHYPNWASYRSYTTPVPRGFWLHALEHGAVVITHHCPDGCATDIAALQLLIDQRPVDPFCVAPVLRRIVMTPDPLSPTRFAVVAWGHALTGDCLDRDAIYAFIDDRYALGAPENTCAEGIDPTSPSSGIPADCGSATDGGM